jgi:hypothetical protein
MVLSGKLVRGFVAVIEILAQKEEGKRGNTATEEVVFTVPQDKYEELLAFVKGEDILPALGSATKTDPVEDRVFSENPNHLRNPLLKARKAIWAGDCTPGLTRGKKKQIMAYIYPSDEAHFLPDEEPEVESAQSES